MSLQDDFTDAERGYFGSRGRNTDALLAENKDNVQRVTDENPAQSVPAAGADGREAPELGGPSTSQAAAGHPPSPAVPVDDTKSAPAPLEDDEPVDPQVGHPKRVSWPKYQRAMDAHKAAEEKAAALERQHRELQEKWTRLDERMGLFNEALKDDQPQQVEEDPQPDPMQDAYAYMQWQDRQREKLAAELNQWRQQQGQVTHEQQVVQAYRDDATRFSQQNPLFPAMYSYLIQHRDMQLQIAQPEMTPQQRAEAIKAEEFDLASRFLQARRSPAEAVHQMARAYGFDGWYAQQQNNQSVSPGAGGGVGANGANGNSSPPHAQAAPAPSNPEIPTAVQQVQAIAANQNAARSLSNGGGAPLQNIDARALANMTQEEFEAVFNRLQNSRNKAQLRELMGS